MADANRYGECHQNVDEYWRRSGPLNSRKISAAKGKSKTLQSSLSAGLKMVAALAAVATVLVAAANLYVSCSPTDIGEDSADLNVQAFNHQDEIIHYVLEELNGEEAQFVTEGLLQQDQEGLHFDDLKPRQRYRLTFLAEVEDSDELRPVGDFEFTTGPLDEDAPTPPADDDPPAPPAEDDPPAPPAEDDPPAPPAEDDPPAPPAEEDPPAPPAEEDPPAPPVEDDPPAPPAEEDPPAPPAEEDPPAPPAEEEDPPAPPAEEDPPAALESARVDLYGYKTLVDQQLTEGAFQFTLFRDGAAVETVTNYANGGFDFSPLIFDQPGVYQYTVSEENAGMPDIFYDNNVYQITVTVTAGETAYEAVTQIRDTLGSEHRGLEFVNLYLGETEEPEPEVEAATVTLSGQKTLLNGQLESGMFHFVLLQNGAVVESVTHDASGFFSFSSLSFTQPGTYTYQVVEEQGELEDIRYSDESYTVEITVSEGEVDGLQAVPVIMDASGAACDGLNFVNTRIVSASISFSGFKTLIGKELDADMFSFQLMQDNTVLETVTNDADGFFVFSDITYTDPGLYTYQISEICPEGADDRIAYDANIYYIMVEVTEEDGVMYLTDSMTDASGGELETITFENLYIAPLSVTLDANKYLKGRELEEGEFTFRLSGDDVDLTTTNDAEGGISFTLEDLSPGTYTYTLSEVAGDDPDIIYDDTAYIATITVQYTEDGAELMYELSYITAEGDDPETISFLNVYNDPASFEPPVAVTPSFSISDYADVFPYAVNAAFENIENVTVNGIELFAKTEPDGQWYSLGQPGDPIYDGNRVFVEHLSSISHGEVHEYYAVLTYTDARGQTHTVSGESSPGKLSVPTFRSFNIRIDRVLAASNNQLQLSYYTTAYATEAMPGSLILHQLTLSGEADGSDGSVITLDNENSLNLSGVIFVDASASGLYATISGYWSEGPDYVLVYAEASATLAQPGAQLISAEHVASPQGSGAYVCEESHSFRGIAEDSVQSVQITQTLEDGFTLYESSNASYSYDDSTGLLTVTFSGGEIPAGYSATTTVTVNYGSGSSQTSTLDITTPAMEVSFELEPRGNAYLADGYVGVDILDPSHGEFVIDRIVIESELDQEVLLTLTDPEDGSVTISLNPEYAGMEVPFMATVYGHWSLEGGSETLSVSSWAYITYDEPLFTFSIPNGPEGSAVYTYDVDGMQAGETVVPAGTLITFCVVDGGDLEAVCSIPGVSISKRVVSDREIEFSFEMPAQDVIGDDIQLVPAT